MIGVSKGAALGLMCGPAAPVAAPLFALVGGIGGGFLGDAGSKKLISLFKKRKK